METNEYLVEIPGRLHSVAMEHHVAGADEIYDDNLNMTQAQVNAAKADLVEGKVPSSQLPEIDNFPDQTGQNGKFLKTDGTDVSWDNVPNPTVDQTYNASSTNAQSGTAVAEAISNKQNIISDLNTIRSGAAAGATAQQPATTLAGYGITDAYTQASGQALEDSVAATLAEQDNKIDLLNGSEVVVVADHTAVSSPDSQKIYRQYGTTSYTDWMYQNGAWQDIATYSMPGIDNEPTVGSENLVKSGGIYSSIAEEKTIYDSDSDDDFDFSDDNGNVLVLFKDGHIKTKEFDSREVGEKIIYDSDSDDNLDISDDYGNVIAEFKGGHIRTKYFDSRDFAYLDLSGKNVLFFGDSITYYKEYVNAFSSKTGCTPYNRGLGSSCISNGGTSIPVSFCSRVDMTPDNRQDGAGMAIGMPNNVDIDIVIIEGGINDFGYTNSGNKTAFLGDIGVADSLEVRQSFYGGVKYIISRIKTLYPNALVCVLGLIPTYSPSAFPNWSMVTLSDPSNILSTLVKKKTSEDKSWFDYNEALEVTAKQFGALFISLENLGMNPLIESDRIKYYKDGLHPNNTGGELIANKIINSIKNLKA